MGPGVSTSEEAAVEGEGTVGTSAAQAELDDERLDTEPEVDSPDRPGIGQPEGEVALEAQLRRALADLDNLRKRVDVRWPATSRRPRPNNAASGCR